MAFLNKRFVKLYLILFFVSFAFIAPQMRKFIKVPLIQNLIHKTTKLTKTLKTFQIPILETVSMEEYDKISNFVLALPNIKNFYKIADQNTLVCTYDSDKVTEQQILNEIIIAGFTPIIITEAEKKALEIEELEKKYNLEDTVSEDI
jgi:hypothetical protein